MIQLFIYELSKLDEFMFGQYCLKSMNDSIFFQTWLWANLPNHIQMPCKKKLII